MPDTPRIRRRAAEVRKILKSLYPQVKPHLDFDSPFELLVATILSDRRFFPADNLLRARNFPGAPAEMSRLFPQRPLSLSW